MNFLKIAWPMIQSIGLGQARNLATFLGALVIAHGVSAGYTQDQIVGALMCVASIGFNVFDKFVVNRKINTALNTPVPATPAEAQAVKEKL